MTLTVYCRNYQHSTAYPHMGHTAVYFDINLENHGMWATHGRINSRLLGSSKLSPW